MTVLVVGYGSMGRRHAQYAKALGHDVVVADADGSCVATAVKDGYRTTHEAFDPRSVGAVVVATPATTHRAVASSCLAAGYTGPLFVEKPLDVTVDHAAFWASWPHPTQTVGYNWRFHPDVQAWLAVWSDDEAPRLQFECHTRLAEWPGRAYGEPLLECSHELDLLHWLRGPIVWASSSVGHTRASMRCANGDGVLVDWDAQPMRRFRAGPCVRGGRLGAPLEQSYHEALRVFLSAAADGVAVPRGATFGDGLAVIRLCESAHALSDEMAP